MQVYAGLQSATGQSLDERLPRKMNGLNISAYHTVQTRKKKKKLITFAAWQKWADLPVQLLNRLSPIHYWFPAALMEILDAAGCNLPTIGSWSGGESQFCLREEKRV